jgi:prepilin-type N-terminal cleavage/methylation domain-containing protein
MKQHPSKPAKRCGGFTLIEMLVVIGMLGLLAAALTASFSQVKKTARQAQAQSQVSEVATAFNLYLQQERQWPEAWETSDQMDPDVCAIFQAKKLLDLTTWATNGVTISKSSLDRFGMLDPWGRAALRKNPKIDSATAAIEGGRLSDHLIQYRLDLNFDGYVDASEGSPKGAKIRASVLVWSRGPDGKDAATQSKRYPDDDRLSWNYGAARREQ